MDFGSIVIKDTILPTQDTSVVEVYGTTVLHGQEVPTAEGELKGLLPVPPGPLTTTGALHQQRQQNKSQLAWAVSALAAGKGDLLAEQSPKTPHRLQALFMAVSPPRKGQNNEDDEQVHHAKPSSPPETAGPSDYHERERNGDHDDDVQREAGKDETQHSATSSDHERASDESVVLRSVEDEQETEGEYGAFDGQQRPFPSIHKPRLTLVPSSLPPCHLPQSLRSNLRRNVQTRYSIFRPSSPSGYLPKIQAQTHATLP